MMGKNIRGFSIIFILLFFFLLSPKLVFANILISGTRFIYPENKREISIKTQNPDDFPALVQVWIDDGDSSLRAKNSSSPFLVSPPLIRIEPKGGQTFRVFYIPGQENLPRDKESVFYFNLLDVPPIPKQAEGNDFSYMQFSYRSRLKIFFRPDNLPGSALDSASALIWRTEQQGDKVALYVSNPTAYHVSLTSAIFSDGTENGLNVPLDMVAPGEEKVFIIPDERVNKLRENKFNFGWINDYGGSVEQSAVLN